MVEAVLSNLTAVLQPDILLSIALGVVAGILVGALPGFTVVEGVVLTLPLTYGMSALGGLSSMIGVFVGSMSGGLITATLLGIPGTGAAIATTFDAYPMAKRGEAARALALGILSSFVGGMIGGVFLVALAPSLAAWALNFGPWEYFSLTVFAITIIASLAEQSLIKGLIAGVMGLFLSSVGTDPIFGFPRFTLGFPSLEAGIAFIPALIGLYAFSEVLGHMENPKSERGIAQASIRLRPVLPSVWREIARSWVNVVRSSLIGVGVGILPAAGGSIANMVSYGQAKKASPRRHEFGQGCPDGIIAAETANNALAGGALIPTLAFGLPGDSATAVMLGALMLHGIQPGPMLFSSQPQLSYGMIGAYLIANVFMLAWLLLGLSLFTRIHRVPSHQLFPVVLVLCAVGSYAVNHRLFDLWVLLAFGALGYVMRRTGFPLPPLVLGLILGRLAEVNLRQALMTDPNPLVFFTRPISAVLLISAVVSFAYTLLPSLRRQSSPGAAA